MTTSEKETLNLVFVTTCHVIAVSNLCLPGHKDVTSYILPVSESVLPRMAFEILTHLITQKLPFQIEVCIFMYVCMSIYTHLHQ